MTQKKSFSSSALYKLSLIVVAMGSLTACTHHAKLQQQSQAQLAAAQQCISQQQAQSAEFTEQHKQILSQLQQVQAQLATQQKTLDARPQVIERQVPKANCPAPAEAARKNAAKEQSQPDKQIVGLREQAMIAGLNVVMNARISTNVANSVIDARNIQMFERNSEEWVRFTIYNPETNEPHVLERKRLRFQTVQSANPTPDRRPVVEIRFTIGKLSQRGEFILADRSTSEFPILIGRNLLRDVMLVDVSGNNLAPLQRSEAANSSAAKN
jgi:hypothetical protein